MGGCRPGGLACWRWQPGPSPVPGGRRPSAAGRWWPGVRPSVPGGVVAGGGGAPPFQPFQALHHRAEVGVEVAAGESGQGHLQVHPGIGGLSHFHQRGAQHLQGSGETRRGDAVGDGAGTFLLGVGEVAEIHAHGAEKSAAEVVDEGFTDEPGLPARPKGVVDGGEGRPVIHVGQRFDDGVHRFQSVGDAARGGNLVEGRQSVASRSRSSVDGVVDGVVAQLQPGLLGHPAGMILQHLAVDEVELQVLRAAANGGHHLVGFGGAEHEDHVVRGFLQRLQQGVFGAGGEHVNLVQHVDLGPAGGTHGHPGGEVANVVHFVVGGRVQLDQVVRGVGGDGLTGRALAARFTVAGGFVAVEGLGQDPGRAGLAGSPGAAEQVGVPDPACCTAFCRARTTGSWPRSSAKLAGRYRRYRAWWAIGPTLLTQNDNERAHDRPIPVSKVMARRSAAHPRIR